MRNVSDKYVERIKTHFSGSATFFRKLMIFMRLCGKIFRAREATDDNRAHAIFHVGYPRLQTHT